MAAYRSTPDLRAIAEDRALDELSRNDAYRALRDAWTASLHGSAFQSREECEKRRQLDEQSRQIADRIMTAHLVEVTAIARRAA